jgi:hypothetical protein
MSRRLLAAASFLALGCASNSVAGGIEYRAVQPRRPQVAVPAAPVGWLGSQQRSETGAFVGVAYDCLGAPIAGARMRVRDRETAATDTVLITDSLGAVSLGPITVGDLVVEVRALGYEPRIFERSLLPGRVDSLSVRMTAAYGMWADCFTVSPCPTMRMFTCTTAS